MKKILKKAINFCLLTSVLINISCSNDSQPSSPYFPDDGNYTPKETPTDLQRNAVDGVRPKIVIKNTFLRVHPEVGVFIKDLFGNIHSKIPSLPADMDDVTSFSVVVHQANLLLDGQNMDNLMKNFVLNYPGAPLFNLKHTVLPGSRLRIEGKMRQAGIGVPFEMEGPVRPTYDGNIEIVPDKIKAAGVSSKGVMDLVGLQTAKLINLNEKRGLKLEGNKIIMFTDRLFPPPVMKGKVTKVDSENGSLSIFFDDGSKVARPPLPVPEGLYKNYKHIYGGAVKMIGNEIHENTNVMMVDMNQSNPFDFYLAEYYNHLIAGQVHAVSRAGALVTYMPDYPEIQSRLERLPLFSGTKSELGPKSKINYDSDPKKDKNKNWANQPKTVIRRR